MNYPTSEHDNVLMRFITKCYADDFANGRLKPNFDGDAMFPLTLSSGDPTFPDAYVLYSADKDQVSKVIEIETAETITDECRERWCRVAREHDLVLVIPKAKQEDALLLLGWSERQRYVNLWVWWKTPSEKYSFDEIGLK